MQAATKKKHEKVAILFIELTPAKILGNRTGNILMTDGSVLYTSNDSPNK